MGAANLLGNTGVGAASRFYYVSAAGQQTFTGADSSPQALTLNYTPGYVEVSIDGIWQTPDEYTATNGSSIVFPVGLAAGRKVYVYCLASFAVAGAVSFLASQSLSTAQQNVARSNIGMPAGQVPGTTGNTQPTAGNVGELITSGTVTIGFTTTATPQNVTSILLTPGVWDLEFVNLHSGAGATSSSDWWSAMSTTTATVSAAIVGNALHTRSPAGADMAISHSHPRARVAVLVNTTVFLNAQATFSTSTYGCTGKLEARRAA